MLLFRSINILGLFVLEGSTFCGGTIVASRYIISAAHCFFSTDDTRILTTKDIKFWIGDHNIFISRETFIPEKQIRKLRRDHFYQILMSFLLVVLPSLPTILQEIILITKVKTSDRDSFDNQLATVAAGDFWKTCGSI